MSKIKLQGLLVAERVNYDFVEATTPTDLLPFFRFIISFSPSIKRFFGQSKIAHTSSKLISLLR